MNGTAWTREHIIVAYTLYCVTPLNKIRLNNEIIQKAAKKINHSTSSLVLRMQNFTAIDPESNKKGCNHTAKLDKKIFEEFKHDWYTLCNKGEEYLGFKLFDDDSVAPINGSKLISSLTEHSRTQKERAIFRTQLRATYDGKCCITQVDIPEILRASHTKDFSKSPDFLRISPTNGLLLNAFHDALFDKGLITVTPDYTIHVSKRLKLETSAKNEFAQRWIFGTDNTKIILPSRFQSDIECLKWHNTNKFERWNI